MSDIGYLKTNYLLASVTIDVGEISKKKTAVKLRGRFQISRVFLIKDVHKKHVVLQFKNGLSLTKAIFETA